MAKNIYKGKPEFSEKEHLKIELNELYENGYRGSYTATVTENNVESNPYIEDLENKLSNHNPNHKKPILFSQLKKDVCEKLGIGTNDEDPMNEVFEVYTRELIF